MTGATHKPVHVTARQKIEESVLDPKAAAGLQGLGDLDLEKLVLNLRGVLPLDVVDNVTDVTLERTIEGASTLTVSLVDDDREILRSGRLARGLSINVDGLWFTDVQVRKSDKNLDIVFEDREVHVLRTYNKKKGPISRAKISRAQFVQSLAEEPTEVTIKTYIPELLNPQPIAKQKGLKRWGGGSNATQGIPKNSGGYTPETAKGIGEKSGLTVKNQPASNTQIQNANTILSVGVSQGARRKVLVAGIMVAIGESSISNLTDAESPGTRSGVFQQDPRYWPASGDVATDAAAFWSSMIGLDKSKPDLPYYALGRDVQHPGRTAAESDAVALATYGPWRVEAERWVTDYGIAGGVDKVATTTVSTNEAYFFFRGIPPTRRNASWGKEDSWTCIQRLASEVQWRAFMVAGTLIYADEEFLLTATPAFVIDKDTDGLIGDPDFDSDINKAYSTMTVSCFIRRWLAPPGTVVVVRDMGPANGRWLVTQTNRSFFRDQGTITLKRPMQGKPEPADKNLTNAAGGVYVPIEKPQALKTARLEGLSSVDAATKILDYHKQGRYRDDNGRQLAQLQKVAAGLSLHSQCGTTVYMDKGVLNALLLLLDSDYLIGTFALCEDHHCNDGQHPKGQAVDISSIGRLSSGWGVVGDRNTVTTAIMETAMLALQPLAWDLLCNGNGVVDPSIQVMQVDNTSILGRPARSIVSDHIDHMHFGAAKGRRD